MYILNKKQKIGFVLLTIVIIIGAFLEMVGVSAILPVVYVIMDEQSVITDPRLNFFYKGLGFESTRSFMTFLIGMIVLLYFVKNVFLAYRNYFKFKFVQNTRCEISVRMMRCYLKQPYIYHSLNNSAKIQRNVVNDAGAFKDYILAISELMVGAILCLLLIVYMLVTDPFITIMLVVIFGLVGVLVLKPFNKILNRYGEDSRSSGENIVKWVNQSLGGIKEVKIGEKENFFADKFTKAASIFAHAEKMNQVLATLPGLIMETVAIGGVLVLVIIKLSFGENASNLIPVLSAIALAGMKLLAAFNTTTSALSRIYFTRPSMEALYYDLKELEGYPMLEMDIKIQDKNTFNKEITVKNVSYSYPESDRKILNGIDMKIECGTSVAFIGTSGMGKTTLADVVLGVLEPQSGEIFVDGVSMNSDMAKWHRMFGYIPQTIYMMDDTIRNNIAFGIDEENIVEEDIWKAVEEAQLREFIESLEDGLDTVIGEQGMRLSGGQRQRIGIARALYSRPSILVLDEATSALDNDTEKAVMEAIDGLHGKLTMIIIAHRLTTIQNCDKVYEIFNGTIIERSQDYIEELINKS